MKLLVMLVMLLVSEYLRIEKEKKIRSEKRRQLSELKIEIELRRKREAFEKFKARIEAFKDESEIEVDEVDIKEVDEVDNTFVEGVTALRDNGPKYVPYERPNPLNDIRNSLSEFTVNDIINTFYI